MTPHLPGLLNAIAAFDSLAETFAATIDSLTKCAEKMAMLASNHKRNRERYITARKRKKYVWR